MLMNSRSPAEGARGFAHPQTGRRLVSPLVSLRLWHGWRDGICEAIGAKGLRDRNGRSGFGARRSVRLFRVLERMAGSVSATGSSGQEGTGTGVRVSTYNCPPITVLLQLSSV